MLHRERVKDQMNHSILLHPADSSSLRPLLLAISLLLFVLLPCLCDEVYSQGFTECKPRPSNCGDFNISYPFKSSTDPPHCGYPGLVLSCDDRRSFISIGGKNYQVTNINYAGRFLEVVDPATSEICFHPRDNITGNTSHFIPDNYSDFDVNFLSCSEPTSSYPFQLIPFTVPESCPDFRKSYYYWTNDSLQPGIKQFGCELVQVPVKRDAFDWMFKLEDKNLLEALKEGFTLNWTEEIWKNCSDCVSSNGACGFDGVQQVCYCPNNMYNHEVSCRPRKTSNHTRTIIGSSVAGAVFLVIITFLGLLFYRRRKRTQFSSVLLSGSQATSYEPSSKKDDDVVLELEHPATKLFQYEELHEATGGFSESNELGDGGFGTVYKGTLNDGRTVAIKRLYENNYRRVEQFRTEVLILSSLRHPYLVSLYGCTSRHSRELLLVYEYVANGTVADHLHGPRVSEQGLPWCTRMSIAVETAEALSFLHAVTPQIIHRDVKTNNILLDGDFHVKVADFGLSRLFPVNATHVSTAPQGTPGYVDPEYHQCYQLTDKSDVYSFGVVLAELISSRPAVDLCRRRDEINLASMALSKIQNDQVDQLVDPKLQREYSTAGEVVWMINHVAELAFRCLQPERETRPTMKEVLDALRGIEEEICNRAAANKEKDHVSMLKENPGSPKTVTAKWESYKSTPNTSA